MRKLFQILKKYYITLVFLFLELIGFLLLVNFNTYHQISYLSWMNEFTGGFYQRVTNISQHIKLVEVNEKLVAENAELRSQLQNAYLHVPGGFNPWVDTTYHQQYVYRNAQVINNDISGAKNYLMINQGSLAGITKEMGVINANGLVGIVTDVSKHFSVVMSVLNTDFKVGVRLKNSDYFGILSWNGKRSDIGVLDNIQSFVTVNPGDSIETIGASGIFPEGLLVGVVEEIEPVEESRNWRIFVKLSANVQQANHVYVLENIFQEEIIQLTNPAAND